MLKSDHAPAVKRLVDYSAPLFTIETVVLTFQLEANKSLVTNRMQVQRVGDGLQPLVLDGEALILHSITVDGQVWPTSQYQLSDSQLVINDLPARFELCLVTEIDPSANTSLSGLYLSEGAYCTQCEAEGFRRITYYLDRPDVLAVFTCRIEAATTIPYLLSNGNKREAGELADGKHYVVWHDPHPKPCYLFALVAGDFDQLEDRYCTIEGREVTLQLFVDRGNKHRGEFALAALKRSMAWDEQRFGLAYDLDIYMVVAVDFFNMGAMENKGLNVFNSKYVLAEPASATDLDYHNIEAVIGHEYFHNWTGNRVTCRDWFQLSLKEGLTVFRDQEFSADMGSAAVNRLQNVRIIQNQQFAEDAGPMAHPIRPAEVIEMNNFYTVTVYNKGAEVIRMIHTLLGEGGFRKGMDLYFKRHDGQAVTCDDFVAAMEDASGVDLTQFRRWYSQSGTPVVSITDEFDPASGCYRLHCTQYTAPTADQQEKQAQHIPLVISLYDHQGQELSLMDGNGAAVSAVLNFTQPTQTFEFYQIESQPVPALLANFSAPVKLEFNYSMDDLSFLVKHASDPYVKWQAMQRLYSDQIFAAEAAGQESIPLPEEVVEACLSTLNNPQLDLAIIAEIIAVPSVGSLVQLQAFSDIDRLCRLRDATVRSVGSQLADQMLSRLDGLKTLTAEYQYHANDIAVRALRATLLDYLAAAGLEQQLDLSHRYQLADNMTDKLAVLTAVNHWQLACRVPLLKQYEQQWQHDPLVMDKWLSLQATATDDGVVERIKSLYQHPVFSFNNPNRVRALIGTFAAANARQFHRLDGQGYELLKAAVIKLNSLNPQVAARVITPLTQWKKFDPQRQSMMKAALTELLALADLSKDLFEIVDKSLAQ